jgi:multidrug resistance efflux pump
MAVRLSDKIAVMEGEYDRVLAENHTLRANLASAEKEVGSLQAKVAQYKAADAGQLLVQVAQLEALVEFKSPKRFEADAARAVMLTEKEKLQAQVDSLVKVEKWLRGNVAHFDTAWDKENREVARLRRILIEHNIEW